MTFPISGGWEVTIVYELKSPASKIIPKSKRKSINFIILGKFHHLQIIFILLMLFNIVKLINQFCELN